MHTFVLEHHSVFLTIDNKMYTSTLVTKDFLMTEVLSLQLIKNIFRYELT